MARGDLLQFQSDRAAQRDDHAGPGRLSLLSCMRHFPDSRAGPSLWWPDTHSQRTDNKRLKPSGKVSPVKHGCFEDFVFCLFATVKHPWG